jgi:membrane protease YdiL (CAAX protease family)
MADLTLARNRLWRRHLIAGIFLSAVPLFCCGVLLILSGAHALRHIRQLPDWMGFSKVVAASIAVPLIEETFFRGIVLGVLLKTGRQRTSILATSAIFSAIHFLKTPGPASTIVTWSSGLNSIIHSFGQFRDPTMVIAAFATLFVIGWILADARVLTNSLWLSIGLHAGWIFASGTFNRVAHAKMLLLPWLGKNLLVGIIPLALGGMTWAMMRTWLKYDRGSKV